MDTIIFILVCFAAVTGLVAHTKGRNAIGWLVLGFLFGPLALLAVAVASPDRRKAELKEIRAGLQSGQLRKCPACAEAIRREATRCVHCGTEVEALPPQVGLFGRLLGHR